MCCRSCVRIATKSTSRVKCSNSTCAACTALATRCAANGAARTTSAPIVRTTTTRGSAWRSVLCPVAPPPRLRRWEELRRRKWWRWSLRERERLYWCRIWKGERQARRRLKERRRNDRKESLCDGLMDMCGIMDGLKNNEKGVSLRIKKIVSAKRLEKFWILNCSMHGMLQPWNMKWTLTCICFKSWTVQNDYESCNRSTDYL